MAFEIRTKFKKIIGRLLINSEILKKKGFSTMVRNLLKIQKKNSIKIFWQVIPVLNPLF